MSRARTVMMARIRDEDRWIGRCLARTWPVAQTAVLWDDGSEDETERRAKESLRPAAEITMHAWGWRAVGGERGTDVLYFLQSPFSHGARESERVNEIRDKNVLWAFVKRAVDFDFVLCMDGDEMLSLEAIRQFPGAWAAMAAGPDMLQLPVVYLWDAEGQQRCDGIYGPEDPAHKQLRFPRLFTVLRLTPEQLFNTCFRWLGSRGGFHCGSAPQEGFRPRGAAPVIGFLPAPIVHWGYLEAGERQRKYEFYNRVDPNNEFEGRYAHIIGQPDHHAPGPVVLVPYADL